MENYLLVIQYDGSAYNGWQKQTNTSNTIQTVIENALKGLLKQEVEIHGSGRTDKGVHAKAQTANFKCKPISNLTEFLFCLNEKLPADIRVNQIEKVSQAFHSRLSAVAKTYTYHIYYGERPSVFKRKYMYHCQAKVEIDKMKEAAKHLIGEHDFRGFSSEKDIQKNCIRTLYDITITQNNGELILEFYGAGFLYNMVRIMAGSLFEIGTSQLELSKLEEALVTKERKFAGQMLPSHGLFLEHVFYDK